MRRCPGSPHRDTWIRVSGQERESSMQRAFLVVGLLALQGCDDPLGTWPGDLDDWRVANPEGPAMAHIYPGPFTMGSPPTRWGVTMTRPSTR